MRTTLTNFYEDGWDLKVLYRIYEKLVSYMADISCRFEVVRIEDNSKIDEFNDRYDLDLICYPDHGQIRRMKLLFLKGEIVDEKEFHSRYQEYYGLREDMQIV